MSEEIPFRSERLDRVYKYYKFFRHLPVAYFILLSIYTLVSLVRGVESVPLFIINPFIYTFLTPLVLLFLMPAIHFVAYVLYGERYFLEQVFYQLLFFVGGILIFGFLLVGMKFIGSLKEPVSFHKLDIVFVILSLWGIIIQTLPYAKWEVQEQNNIRVWLRSLGESAIFGMVFQLIIFVFVCVPVVVLLFFGCINIIQSNLIWLSGVYLVFAWLNRKYVEDQIEVGREPFFLRNLRNKESLQFLLTRFQRLGIKSKEEENQ